MLDSLWNFGPPEELTSVDVPYLRGNARTPGDQRREEGGNAIGERSRAPVAITILVRNPERKSKSCRIHGMPERLQDAVRGLPLRLNPNPISVPTPGKCPPAQCR